MTGHEIMTLTRPWIKRDDVQSLEHYYHEVLAEDKRIDWGTAWKLLFTNACLYGSLKVAKWLYGLYLGAPLGMRLGLRPTFHYCHATAVRRKSSVELVQWLDVVKSQAIQ